MDDINDERFTLEEYIEYLKLDTWELDSRSDGTPYHSYAEYESDWCGRIKEWFHQSENDSRSIREVWETCYKHLSAPTMRSARATPMLEDNIASARIPILKNECFNEVARLWANDYIPTVTPLSDQVKPLAALGNMYLSQEFKINGWNATKFKLGVDGFVADLIILKNNTTDKQRGPFGQEKKITIDRIDPRNFYPDMKAQKLDWNDMSFIIVTDSMDIGSARSRWPAKARIINSSLAAPEKEKEKRYANSQLLTMPGMQGVAQNTTDRQNIQIKECWLHDERYKFVAETYTDADGKDKTRVDDDGFVVGTWEPAYPYGRMIVTCRDQVVLEDVDNPFWHKEAPFVFSRLNPETGDELLGVGHAADILGFERKINDVETRIHSYGQSEIERPMQADVGALPSNLLWYKTTGQSRAILLKFQGKAFLRPPPVETPIFVERYLQRLDAYKQDTMGVPGIMQGQIAEGSTLSAQSVQSTQAFGASRSGMQATYISEFMRKEGLQVFELIRETYPENISASIMLPTGEMESIQWNSDALDYAYFIGIDLASNQPGGQAAKQQFLMQGYEKGLFDRIYMYQNMGIDGWQDLEKRMRDRETQLIEVQAAGRAAGLQIKEITKPAKQPGRQEGG